MAGSTPPSPEVDRTCPYCGIAVDDANAPIVYVGEFGKRARRAVVFHPKHQALYLATHPSEDPDAALAAEKKADPTVAPPESV